MSDVLEAELAQSGSLKAGWIDLGKKDLFPRYLGGTYLGLIFLIPSSAFGLGRLRTMNSNSQSRYCLAVMLLKIPFSWLVWAQPVERFVNLPWVVEKLILLGTITYRLGCSTLFIDIRTTWVFVDVTFVALIPRLFAEQAVVRMMAESIPNWSIQFRSQSRIPW